MPPLCSPPFARDYDQGLELNLERLAAWVTTRAGGDGARFVGAYYYTGM